MNHETRKPDRDRRANKIIEEQIVDRNYVNAQRMMINLWTVPSDCLVCFLSMMIMWVPQFPQYRKEDFLFEAIYDKTQFEEINNNRICLVYE